MIFLSIFYFEKGIVSPLPCQLQILTVARDKYPIPCLTPIENKNCKFFPLTTPIENVILYVRTDGLTLIIEKLGF